MTNRKRVTHAVATTIICDDESIYVIRPDEPVAFTAGETVEIDEGELTLIRSENAPRWVSAIRIR